MHISPYTGIWIFTGQTLGHFGPLDGHFAFVDLHLGNIERSGILKVYEPALENH